MCFKGYARQIEKHLTEVDADFLFCPSNFPIAYLNWNKPTVFWTDMTFNQVLASAAAGSPLTERFVEVGHRMEKRALERCTLATLLFGVGGQVGHGVLPDASS